MGGIAMRQPESMPEAAKYAARPARFCLAGHRYGKALA